MRMEIRLWTFRLHRTWTYFIILIYFVKLSNSSLKCQCNVESNFFSTIDISCSKDKSTSKVACSKGIRSTILKGYRYLPGLGLYKLNTLSKTWLDAKDTCEREGGRLAIPQNADMGKALVKLLPKDSGIYYGFIGVSDLASPSFYQGVDGKLAPYLNWARGEPNNFGGKEHCLVLVRDEFMNDFTCDKLSPYFCERPLHTIIPEGYVFIEAQGFYKLHKEKRSFTEAEAFCVEEGGHLAVPETTEEAATLVELTKADSGLGAVWIGLTDKDDEGTFVSIRGTHMTDFSFDNWAPREPNDANGNEDCVTFLPYGYLNDASCSQELPFICELTFR